MSSGKISVTPSKYPYWDLQLPANYSPNISEADALTARLETLFAARMGVPVPTDTVLHAVKSGGAPEWLSKQDNEDLHRISLLTCAASSVETTKTLFLTLDLPEYRESFVSQFLPHRWVRNMYHLAQTHSFAVGVALGLAAIQWGPKW